MERPAAWHPDPAGTHDHRWWDGERWTEHVADAGVASVDPLPAAPGADAGTAAAADRTTGDGIAGEEPTPGDSATTAAAPGDGADVTGTGPSTGGASPAGDQPPWEQGASRPEDPPAWGQQPSSDPGGSAPWGGAPAAAPSWSQSQQPSWEAAGGQPGASDANGMAVAALVTGILSLPLLIAAGLGGLLGIVAVVLGIIAVRRANRGQGGGRGMAIGGIVTGAISILFGIFIAIFIFTFGVGVVEEMEACLEETGGDDQECQRRLEREVTDRFLGD